MLRRLLDRVGKKTPNPYEQAWYELGNVLGLDIDGDTFIVSPCHGESVVVCADIKHGKFKLIKKNG